MRPLQESISKLRRRLSEWRYGAVDRSAPVGKQGEQIAARLLRRKGLVVVAQSEADRAGEIDLIAVDRRARAVVFVEVKTHQLTTPGHPAERVDAEKQSRVIRAAQRYLKRKRLLGVPMRFDVVAVWLDRNSGAAKAEHYEAVF